MGCDRKVSLFSCLYIVSIHAPRVGCDILQQEYNKLLNVSIHAPRVGCDIRDLSVNPHTLVSIHAPRVGCDVLIKRINESAFIVSIHAPRVGCDRRSYRYFWFIRCFNPRTPGGVRQSCPLYVLRLFCFNPRTPGGVRQLFPVVAPTRFVSIHAPRAGCDTSPFPTLRAGTVFQSTHPGRGATVPPPSFADGC